MKNNDWEFLELMDVINAHVDCQCKLGKMSKWELRFIGMKLKISENENILKVARGKMQKKKKSNNYTANFTRTKIKVRKEWANMLKTLRKNNC